MKYSDYCMYATTASRNLPTVWSKALLLVSAFAPWMATSARVRERGWLGASSTGSGGIRGGGDTVDEEQRH